MSTKPLCQHLKRRLWSINHYYPQLAKEQDKILNSPNLYAQPEPSTKFDGIILDLGGSYWRWFCTIVGLGAEKGMEIIELDLPFVLVDEMGEGDERERGSDGDDNEWWWYKDFGYEQGGQDLIVLSCVWKKVGQNTTTVFWFPICNLEWWTKVWWNGCIPWLVRIGNEIGRNGTKHWW